MAHCIFLQKTAFIVKTLGLYVLLILLCQKMDEAFSRQGYFRRFGEICGLNERRYSLMFYDRAVTP